MYGIKKNKMKKMGNYSRCCHTHEMYGWKMYCFKLHKA